MSNRIDLPIEILDNIFQRISPTDSGSCSLVCRAWKLPAQRILFEEIPPLTDEQFNEFTLALSQHNPNQTPANFVKTLNCHNMSQDYDIAFLHTVFPFLEAINIDRSQQGVYQRIRRLVLDGLFPNLQKMPYMNWGGDHIELVLSRKESIRNLELQSQLFDAIPKEMFEKLHLFPELTSLTVKCHSTRAEMQYLESFLVKAPSTIKTIDFEFASTVEIFDPSIPKSDIQSLPNVEKVKIALIFLFFGGEETYLYMMKKFPNIKMLEITVDTNTATTCDNYKVPSVACLTQFLIYLFSIKNSCSVPSIITNEHTIAVVKGFQDYVISQKLSASSNIEFNFNIEFILRDSWDSPDYSDNLKAFITPCFKRLFHKKVCEIKVVYKVNPAETLHPHLGLLQEVGNMDVHSLTLGHHRQRNSKSQLSVPLDTVLNHWTKLKKLRINGSTSITYAESMTDLQREPSSTLESLEFYMCDLNEEIFPKISKKCLNLKSLTFDTCRPEKKHILIDMRHTLIDELNLHVNLQTYLGDYDSALICVKTSHKKPRYCMVYSREYDTEYQTDCPTEEEFNLYLKDNECYVYDIFCDVVKKVTITFDTRFSEVERFKKRVLLEEGE